MTPACFFEDDPGRALWRRAGAEGAGTTLPAATGAALAAAAETLGGLAALAMVAAVGLRAAEVRP